MAYSRYYAAWHNSPTTDTPITAAALDHVEDGLVTAAATADAAVPKSLVTTAGDLIYATASATLARLGIGAANRVLKTSGSAPSWGQIVNADVDAAAAIAYSKLNLATSIVNADISASAAIDPTKANLKKGTFSAYRVTSNQTGIVSGVATKVQFNGEEYDVDSWYDSVTNFRYTPLVAGYYRFNGFIYWASSLTDQTRISVQLYKNGSLHKYLDQIYVAATSNDHMCGGTCQALANGSTDYFEVFVVHNAGSNKDIGASQSQTYFQGELIGSS